MYICGAQSGIEAVFSCSALVFSPQYHSNYAPYSSTLNVVDSLWTKILTVLLSKTLEVSNISKLYFFLYYNEELSDLYSLPNIVRVVKSRMRWAGHVARMGEGRRLYRVLVGNPEGKRPLGRPRRRWEDNIKMDLQEVGRGL